MKRLCFLFIAAMMTVCSYGQEAYLKKALKSEKSEAGILYANIIPTWKLRHALNKPDPKTHPNYEELSTFLYSNGYCMVSCDIDWLPVMKRDIYRHETYDTGEKKPYVRSFGIVAKNDIEEFSYNYMRPGYRNDKPKLKKATFMAMRRDTKNMVRKECMWTGEVVDGYISGEGDAYFHDDTGYYYFVGEAYKGFVLGLHYVRGVITKDKGISYDIEGHDDRFYFEGGTAESINAAFQAFPDMKAAVSQLRDYCYERDYNKWVKGIYEGKVASARENKTSRVSADENMYFNRFLKCYSEECQYDPKNYVKQINEVYEYCKVGVALNYTPAEKYYTPSANITYDSQREADDEKALTEGLAIAQKGSQFGFASFYAYAQSVIQGRLDAVRRNASRDKKLYQQALDEKAAFEKKVSELQQKGGK